MKHSVKVLISVICLSITFMSVYSQTQYDYYDDEVYYDRVDPSYFFLGLIILAVGVIAILIACSVLINIYYWFNPKASPEYKAAEAKRLKILQEEQRIKEERANAVFEAIDLGLSVKWASFNLGAYKPSDMGDYFYWSNTRADQPRPSYPANNVNVLGDFSGNSKYDAATCQIGDNWRTPTVEECEELIDKCKWEDSIIDGIAGKKVTGPNGNSIFLPNNHQDFSTKEYSSGFYWTSTPSFDRNWYNSARDFRFYNKRKPELQVGATANACKFGIRPIYSKNLLLAGTSNSNFSVILESQKTISSNYEYECYKSKSILSKEEEAIAFSEFSIDINIHPFHNSENYYQDESGVIFSKKDGRLITSRYCNTDSYVVPEGTTVICEYAFYNGHIFGPKIRPIKFLVLPESLQYISCKFLPENCKIISKSPCYKIIDNLLIDTRNRSLIKCLNSFVKSIDIPEGIVEIESWAFSNFVALSEVIMPNSLRVIRANAFHDCRYLSRVKLSDNIEIIEEKAFFLCSALKEINMPQSIKTIGDFAFSSTIIERFEIPSSLISLGCGVFPPSCKQINSSNKRYYVEDSMLIDKENNELVHFVDDNREVFITPSSILNIKMGAISHSNFKKAVITSNVKSLTRRLFSNCKDLAEVVLPENVTSIPQESFSYCESLSGISIPPNVLTIESGAFYGCKNLLNVRIPESVTSIGGSAFSKCVRLSNITLPQSVAQIGKYCFEGCNELTSINYNCKKCEIEQSLAHNLESLRSIVIGEDCTFIDHSLCSCNNLIDKVTFPEKVSYITNSALYNLKNLKTIVIFSKNIKLQRHWVSNCPKLKTIYIFKDIEESVRSSISEEVSIKYISPLNRLFL